jgi:excinuclease ABC subunit C
MNPTLQSQLEDLPKFPGVYLFSDSKKKLLYVGKAKILRNRVRSYFNNSPKGPRITRMVSKIASVEVIVTKTEAEALLLENSLIKNQKPRFNVMLRDDKTYPYIKVTDEPYPRVLFTRRRSKNGRFFGPFPSAYAARQSIRLIHQHFKVRSCDLELGSKSFRPCLQYHIKRCDAPCDFKVERAEYMRGVQRAELFLEGKTDDLVKEVSEEMQDAAQKLQFERAAYFRDLLGTLNLVQRRQHVSSLKFQRMDVVEVTREGWSGNILIMAIRAGNIARTQTFPVEWEESPDEDLPLWLTHYYLNHEDPPDEIVLDAVGDMEMLIDAYASQRGKKLAITNPQRGSKKRLLDMAYENIYINLEMQRQENDAHPAVVQLADILGLGKLPDHLECFDISNTMGTNNVAAMVCFKNGKPDKKNYRKFNIKTVEGANDFASMAEVVHRRYKRLLEEGQTLPDIVVVDGGLGQLHAAHEAMVALGLGDHPLISLAKKEEWVYRVGSNDPIMIDHREPALRMLQQARDEAHRFGITFHRKKRGKAMLESELDGLPGVGPARKKKLLLHFGSVKRMKDATVQQLAGVVGPKVAETLFQHFHRS